MTQTVGIIGAGMIGGALARLSAAAGLDVLVANSRGPESLAALVGELGGHGRAVTVSEAARASDLVIAAVPMSAYAGLPVEDLEGQVVIDTMNYYPARDGVMPDIDAKKFTTSEMLQSHLSGSKVVKALHNLDFHHLYINARPHGHPERTTLPIAGDEASAKAQVAGFMDMIGYDSIDIGPLSESWRIEPGSPIYVWPYVPAIPQGLSEAEARRSYLQSGPPVSHAAARDLVAKADRAAPVGGFSEVLPKEHVALVREVFQSRS